MMQKKLSLAIFFLILSGILLCGCSDKKQVPDSVPEETASHTTSGTSQDDTLQEDMPQDRTPRDNTPQVLVPEASGSSVLGNDFIIIDASHTDNGYFMVQYLGDNNKVKLRVAGPDQSEYIYLLSGSGNYETFPLPCGSGNYQIQVFENAGGDMYATAYSTDIDVSIADEFSPFLYPNQYVNFTPDSLTVAKGSDLAKDAYSDLDVVESIYNYITEQITYDEELAANVTYGYLPVVDETLTSGKGICFDYAAVMCAMLRSQRIPTKLEVGYSGEAYHAWISAYITENGWVDGIIQFDGTSWTLIDPTLGANSSNESVKQYIGDASNYVVKYSY